MGPLFVVARSNIMSVKDKMPRNPGETDANYILRLEAELEAANQRAELSERLAYVSILLIHRLLYRTANHTSCSVEFKRARSRWIQ